jgi:3-deoxy-D-manno-octulosonic-acid transferase
MRYIYTFFLYLLTPFIVFRLYWKGRRLPAYRQRILERFSLGQRTFSPVDIWVHAVSLGEVVAVTPLVDAFLAKRWRVLVTTMTPTGSQQVIKRFGQHVAHQYVPYDLPWALRRFFRQTNPRLGLIMETELWPNIIHQAKQMKIPLLLANARLSDRAFKRYEKVDFMFKPILNQLTAIFTQSDEDAKRFIALGAAADKVEVLGNMKFDVQLQAPTSNANQELKEKWGMARTVVIAASTHDDEEKQLLTRLSSLKIGIPNVLLLFAPRHPERFQDVYTMSRALGFKTGLRSLPATIDDDTEVVVIDSLGELLSFYQVSDYAFVGGSLVPIGGHNVLEPIAVQVPVFCGPFMNNSKEICRDLDAVGAMLMVENADGLIAALIDMYLNEVQRQQQIKNASAVLSANRGAVIRCMERIEPLLSSRS